MLHRRTARPLAAALVTATLCSAASVAPSDPVPCAPGTTSGHSDVLAGPGLLSDPQVPAPPAPVAGSWLVVDAGSGDVLAACNSRTRFAPASTLKVLTALALAPGHDDAEIYTASSEAVAVEGSKTGVHPESTYRYTDLLHALVMASGNDAAVAMAELAGGQAPAVEAMNTYADQAGASDTTALNTSGLDAPGQVSSARDLALLATPALDDPRLAQIMVTETYQFPGEGKGFGRSRPTFQIGNHNRLLGDEPGILGVKNGYTDAARHSLVAAADRDGRRIVVVLMRAEAPVYEQARALLRWGFSVAGRAAPVTTLATSIESDEADQAEAAGAAGAAGVGDQATADAVAPISTPAAAAQRSGASPWILPFGAVGFLALAILVLRLRVVLSRGRTGSRSGRSRPAHGPRPQR